MPSYFPGDSPYAGLEIPEPPPPAWQRALSALGIGLLSGRAGDWSDISRAIAGGADAWSQARDQERQQKLLAIERRKAELKAAREAARELAQAQADMEEQALDIQMKRAKVDAQPSAWELGRAEGDAARAAGQKARDAAAEEKRKALDAALRAKQADERIAIARESAARRAKQADERIAVSRQNADRRANPAPRPPPPVAVARLRASYEKEYLSRHGPRRGAPSAADERAARDYADERVRAELGDPAPSSGTVTESPPAGEPRTGQDGKLPPILEAQLTAFPPALRDEARAAMLKDLETLSVSQILATLRASRVQAGGLAVSDYVLPSRKVRNP